MKKTWKTFAPRRRFFPTAQFSFSFFAVPPRSLHHRLKGRLRAPRSTQVLVLARSVYSISLVRSVFPRLPGVLYILLVAKRLNQRFLRPPNRHMGPFGANDSLHRLHTACSTRSSWRRPPAWFQEIPREKRQLENLPSLAWKPHRLSMVPRRGPTVSSPRRAARTADAAAPTTHEGTAHPSSGGDGRSHWAASTASSIRA
jgi:hypothetical protein